jgi:hypothetical protein
LKVSKSGYYEWRSRPASTRDLRDAHLINEIRDLHRLSRGTYGVRRVHAELTLSRRHVIGHGRVEKLMRLAGLQGVHHRKWRHGSTGRLPAVFEDRVKRVFHADAPDELWVTDIEQHRTAQIGDVADPDLGQRSGVPLSFLGRDGSCWATEPVALCLRALAARAEKTTARIAGMAMKAPNAIRVSGAVSIWPVAIPATDRPRKTPATTPKSCASLACQDRLAFGPPCEFGGGLNFRVIAISFGRCDLFQR